MSKKLSLKMYKSSRSLQLIARKNFNPNKVTQELYEEANKLR